MCPMLMLILTLLWVVSFQCSYRGGWTTFRATDCNREGVTERGPHGLTTVNNWILFDYQNASAQFVYKSYCVDGKNVRVHIFFFLVHSFRFGIYELPFEGIYMLSCGLFVIVSDCVSLSLIRFLATFSLSVFDVAVAACVCVCVLSGFWCREQSKMRRYIDNSDGDDDVVGTQSMIMPMI